MNNYEKRIKTLEERFGNGKDNIICLATIATELNKDDKPRPCVRDVNAFYENSILYVTTYALSNKMMQIDRNPEVSFSICFEAFSGYGVGKNMGWVLDPKNMELRSKLRKVFSKWYDEANNEADENTCILAIHMTKGTLVEGHGETRKVYQIDFLNKTAD